MVEHRRWIAPLAAMALVAVACHGREDRATAERLIREYNRAVIEVHLTRSMEPVQKLVSRDEHDRLEITLVGLTKRGELLRASLESLEVRSAELDPGKGAGTAYTDERWTYDRIDPKTGEVKLAKHEASYRLKYDLRRVEGAWVVDKVRHETEAGSKDETKQPPRDGAGEAPKGADAPVPHHADVVRENTQHPVR